MEQSLSASFQIFKTLFVLVHAIAENAANNDTCFKENKKFFLQRRKNENCKVLFGGRNFYDQLINGLIKQNDEVRKVSTGQCHDYTTGSLLVYAYFKDNYRLIAVDLSNKKALDPDIRANQQVLF